MQKIGDISIFFPPRRLADRLFVWRCPRAVIRFLGLDSPLFCECFARYMWMPSYIQSACHQTSVKVHTAFRVRTSELRESAPDRWTSVSERCAELFAIQFSFPFSYSVVSLLVVYLVFESFTTAWFWSCTLARLASLSKQLPPSLCTIFSPGTSHFYNVSLRSFHQC